MENYVGQQQYQIQQPIQTPQVSQVAVNQPQTNPIQSGTVQVPNYSGVNIQIFNPTVATPGTAINAPQYYPAGYYTNQWGNTTTSNNSGNNGENITEKKESTTNINTTNHENVKKEKRDIVILTDDYIKNLENYLNSQDKEIRMMGAKEVVARLQEDDSRKDDKALTALINKMLQDPSQQIRILALSMLDSRTVTGDEYTKGVLQQMQSSDKGYGQDALLASNILLKMSGQVAQKEFEVKDKPKVIINYNDYIKGQNK